MIMVYLIRFYIISCYSERLYLRFKIYIIVLRCEIVYIRK